ncbi:MAG TPA: response regulator transcription factor [Chthoniobacteraceae bacterium]|jgi:DNA-binding NarL/FixJ family response regulator
MSKRTRILIVDDHFMVRTGLAEAMRGERDLQVVAKASTGAQAIADYTEHQPDVVTMDYRLPDMDGVETAKAILAQDPEARILMLSVFEGEEDIWRAVQAGVRGYLLKSCESSEVLGAIRRLALGGTAFSEDIAKRIEARRSRSTLTQREMETLAHIVAGRSNKEIIHAMGLSEGTVKLHIGNVLEKLGAKDRTQAAIIAVQRGILHVS